MRDAAGTHVVGSARCTRAAMEENGLSCETRPPGVRRGDASLPGRRGRAGDAGGLCGSSINASITVASKV